jgi:hypothetical protein
MHEIEYIQEIITRPTQGSFISPEVDAYINKRLMIYYFDVLKAIAMSTHCMLLITANWG